MDNKNQPRKSTTKSGASKLWMNEKQIEKETHQGTFFLSLTENLDNLTQST